MTQQLSPASLVVRPPTFGSVQPVTSLASPPPPVLSRSSRSISVGGVSPPIVVTSLTAPSTAPSLVQLKPLSAPLTPGTIVRTPSVRVTPVTTVAGRFSIEPSIRPATPVSPSILQAPPSPTPGILSGMPGFTTSPRVTPIVTTRVTPAGRTILSAPFPVTVAPSPPVVLPPTVLSAPATIPFIKDKVVTVEDSLAEKGYRVTDRIFVMHNGVKHAKYVKVTSSMTGEEFLVELNRKGQVIDQPGSRVTVAVREASIVPETTIRASYDECVKGTGVCGIAFDCTDEVCVVKRPATSAEVVTPIVLKVASGPTAREAVISGLPTALPVLSSVEIEQSPREAAAAGERGLKAIRNASWRECVDNWRDLDRATTEMRAAEMEFRNLIFGTPQTSTKGRVPGVFEQLATDINTVKGYQSFYLSQQELSPEDKEKHMDTVTTIMRRSEQLSKLFALCREVPAATSRVEQITASFKAASTHINDNYQDLGDTAK